MGALDGADDRQRGRRLEATGRYDWVWYADIVLAAGASGRGVTAGAGS